MNFAHLISENTVPAFPLGQPVDGRPRYGMTPDMAEFYSWLVKYKPHTGVFGINFRESAWRMLRHPSKVHFSVRSLVERGWLDGEGNTYSFVHPIMHFKTPRA